MASMRFRRAPEIQVAVVRSKIVTVFEHYPEFWRESQDFWKASRYAGSKLPLETSVTEIQYGDDMGYILVLL